MPEDLTDRRCCHKCQMTSTGKKKLLKCGQCESITYCGQKCQREDWSRHRQFCIPVMVTEIPGKGKGLVASKDFKKGQVLFRETAAITIHVLSSSNIVPIQELKDQISHLSEEQKYRFYQLTPKDYFNKSQLAAAVRENCLQELDIFATNRLIQESIEEDESINCMFIASSLINHSCAPNVHLDDISDSDNGLEVKAIKDIRKGEEVTFCYTKEGGLMTSSQMKTNLQEDFGFDCKCGVCAGVIPDQDRLIREISKIANVQPNSLYQKKKKGWRIEASKFERAADLTKQLYIGRIWDRIQVYEKFVARSQMARDPIRLEKAMNVLKEEISAFGMMETSCLQATLDRWSTEFQAKRKPTKEEIDDFF